MTLTELGVDELGVINIIDTNTYNIKDMYRLMSMGIVPGLEIRKLGEVATCAEYRVEGNHARIVISKQLSDNIYIDKLDETLD